MRTNRFSFVIAAAFLFAGCASPFVLLVNLKNGTTVECSGMARGITSAVMVSNQVSSCVRQYEALGFVRADQLTEEQRKTLVVKPPERQHRSEPPADAACRDRRRIGGAADVPRDRRGCRHRARRAAVAASEIAHLLSQPPQRHGQAMVSLSELVRVVSTLRTAASTRESLAGGLRDRRRGCGCRSPAYAIFQMNEAVDARRPRRHLRFHPATQAIAARHQVGRRVGHHARAVPDLGAALAVVLLLYLRTARRLVSFLVTPLIVMAAIPFSLVGILRPRRRWERSSPPPRWSASWPARGSWCGTPSSWSTFRDEESARECRWTRRWSMQAPCVSGHAPHRAGRHRGLSGDPLRSDLSGPGDLTGRWRGGVVADQPDGGAGSLRDGMAAAAATGAPISAVAA